MLISKLGMFAIEELQRMLFDRNCVKYQRYSEHNFKTARGVYYHCSFLLIY